MKNKKTSAILSLLFPGLGHLYIKKYADGAVFVVAAVFLWYVMIFPQYSQALNFSSPRAYIFWLGFILIYSYAIIDSYQKTAGEVGALKRHFGLSEIDDLLIRAEGYSNAYFKVIPRRKSFETYGKRKYLHCLGTSFITVLNSAGDMAACLPYWDKKEFVFGNIYEKGFKQIWHGKRRKRIKEYLENRLDSSNCPPNCRCNAINNFLWEIKKPTIKHVNFI
jgi:radical SAM protein with 4Fe4S-binding SPASM domain